MTDAEQAAYWKGAYDRMAARNLKLSEAMQVIKDLADGMPEYHSEGMGCGLEDRNITDRYEAMQHGWESLKERVEDEILEPVRSAAIKALEII